MENNLFEPLETHELKPLLKRHNIRQAQAASRLGVTVHYLNNILNGHVKPSRQLGEDIASLISEMRIVFEPRKENNNGK